MCCMDLARIKERELKILKVFIDICERLDLHYFLVEGSLLGAVRHGGFIPWDDDIDVGMPRADYEVFINEAQKYLPKYLFLQTIYSEPEYHACFAKIRDCRTTFIESEIRHRKINHGIYIDVFPLDNIPDSKVIQAFNHLRVMLCSVRISTVFTVKKVGYKRIALNIAALVAKLVYPRVRDAVIAKDRIFASVPAGENVTNYNSVWKKKEIMPREWYGEGSTLLFEGIPVKVPKHYDEWLTQVYGNYMQYPPVEKRVTRHETDLVDVDKSYIEYYSSDCSR